ncbi:hypothetical protein H206_06976 [Candidatus Electrothrix aarhusensis]|uniref:Uncharacterized protein n=1 Tax=Candidatus Electrothrix aarhusensis TaxID=1859131 RepID=A0A3S3UDM2_9BACT|nr:hypothetical protein H206_06976 [Candidatus Electrothrix aarhusensis]
MVLLTLKRSQGLLDSFHALFNDLHRGSKGEADKFI